MSLYASWFNSVFHGNQRVRDQIASEVISDSFPDPYYMSKRTLTKIKHLNNKYVFLPLNQHKREMKENNECVISFQENFPLGPFWYRAKNNNDADDWSPASLRGGSRSCWITERVLRQARAQTYGTDRGHSPPWEVGIRNWGRRTRREGFEETSGHRCPNICWR